MPRVGAAAALMLGALLGPAHGVQAGEGTASFSDDPSPGYSSSASTSTSSSGGASKTVRRTYQRPGPVDCQAVDGRVGERHYERLGPVITKDVPDTHAGDVGAWYARYCGDSTAPAECAPSSTPFGCLGVPSDRWGFSGVTWWSAADAFGLGAPVDLAEVAADAYAFLPIPTAAIGVNPPGSSSVPALVNLETWLWVDPLAWAPQRSEVEVCCPVVVVSVEAIPERVSFATGDGGTVTCEGPGTPFDPSQADSAQHSDCAHSYTRSSASQPAQRYTVTARVQWSASWAVSGAAPAGGGPLPAVQQATTPVPLRVGEIQSLNTGAT